MTSKLSRGRFEGVFLGFLRGAALIATPAGAVGSLALMFLVGRRQPSIILIVLFTVWVLSPFVALLWAEALSKRWPVVTRATLHIVMLVTTLGSLAIYGVVALGPPRPKPASAFLVVPLASSLFSAIVVAMAALRSGSLLRRLRVKP